MLGSPARVLSSSASSNVMFKTLAIAWVNWLPASDETRVNRGMPRSTTAMLVSPELMWTMPWRSSGSSASSGSQPASVPSSARTRANAVTSTLGELQSRAFDGSDDVEIMSRCAATSRTSIMCSSAGRHVVADDLEVDDRFLDRDRDVVLGLVLDRAGELVALHVGQVDEAHDHLLVGDADRDLL